MKSLLLIMFMFVVACGIPKHAQTKIGGAEIHGSDPLNRYTVHVSIWVNAGDSYRYARCSGTLLTPSQVLLAAHCMIGAWRAQVTVGYHNKVILPNGQSWQAQRAGVSWIAPASYLRSATPLSYVGGKALRVLWETMLLPLPRRTQLKDIALLQLESPLPLPYELTYRIPPPTVDLSGRRVTVAGYGMGRFGQEAGVLRKAKVNVTKDYLKSDVLEFTNFRTRLGFGDSGGPVWWYDDNGKMHLVGIHGMALPLVRFHSFSIDLRQHRAWLTDALRLLPLANPSITPDMDIIKRYLPGFTGDFYEKQKQL